MGTGGVVTGELNDNDRRNSKHQLGRPGASAWAEYRRRRAQDGTRRRARFGRFGSVLDTLIGPTSTTKAWARGAQGEEKVGRFLEQVVDPIGSVLHDRKAPGSRSNLDHLVVVPSGVWVIDTKHYHGRLGRRQAGGWFVSREVLTVGRRDQSRLLASANGQRAVVGDALKTDVPLYCALCFTGVEVSWFARPFVMDGVLVSWPKPLARSLRAPGPLAPGDIQRITSILEHRFAPHGGDYPDV